MPDSITQRTFSFPTIDGQTLFAQEWKLKGTEPSQARKPILGIVHGLGEHSGRYPPVANYFVRHGFHVVSYDHRGHGKTKGKMLPFQTLKNDIQCLCNYAACNDHTPLILYGQSFGAALVLKFLADSSPASIADNNIVCAIASSPLLVPTTDPPRWKILLGERLLPFFPNLRLPHGLKAHDLTHDPQIVNQFRHDPLVSPTVSIALGHSMLASGRELLESFTPPPIPLLLMHGSEDRITSAAATQKLAAKLNKSCRLRVWDGLYHELHYEKNASEVLDYARQFISDYTRFSPKNT